MILDLPYTCEYPSRHGKIQRYVRLPGKRKIRLRADPNRDRLGFIAEYHAAVEGKTPPAMAFGRSREGTFAHLAEAYMRSPAFTKLDRRLTQRPRELILLKLIEKIGAKPAVIDTPTVRDGVARRNYGAAKDFLAALRAVYKFGIEQELVDHDPTASVKLKRPETDGFHTWTVEECAAYEKRWPVGTQARTAYAIGLYAAQRSSDAVKLGKQHLKGGRLQFRQEKNRDRKPVDIDIPVVPALAAALAGWKGSSLTFLETAYGRPYTPDGFRNRFRKWCDEAGLPEHCGFHGLRKAAATRMVEAGKTPHQIMAVLGHKTHQQAATYTAKADRAILADDALDYTASPPIVPPAQVGQNG